MSERNSMAEKRKKEGEGHRKYLRSDVTVAGAGIAGICAAVAAARERLRVILVNDRGVPGGNASSEIGVGVNGASHLGLNASIYAREGGLVEEIRLRMLEYNRGGGYDKLALMDAVLFDMIYEEKNITLLQNTGIYACEKEGDRIRLCYGRHSVSNLVYELESGIYIDATGNGSLAYEAGAAYRMGREARGEFGERKAPEEADSMTMGNTFYFETADCGHEVKYTPPAFAAGVADADFLKDLEKPGNHRALTVKGAHWSFEYGGQRDVVFDSEEIDRELRRLVFGIWDYIKNSGKYPEAANYVLKRVYARSGARESRRFVGDYILTENDIEEKREFEDAVCVGGWPMDVHAPLGIYDPGPATEFIPVTGVYSIPFRCLYSRDVANLMLAGRNISVSHIALGSARVMATCGCMGQAVGTAAKCCVDLQVTPRELGKRGMGLLQERLLRGDQTILGHGELSTLMGRFQAGASCRKRFENGRVTLRRRLDRDYGLALMVDTEHVDSLELWVENCSGDRAALGFEVLEGEHRETFLPGRLVKKGDRAVEAGFCGWLSVPVDADRGRDGKVYLVLKRNPVLEVGMTEEELSGAVTLRLYPEGECGECNHDSVPLDPACGYLYLDHRYNRKENIVFRNIIPEQSVFSPGMVLNPYTRPYGLPNLWLGEGEYPWTLTLTAERPVEAGMLAVTFDTDLRSEPLTELPGCLVRDFDLTVRFEKGIFRRQARDNCRRQVRFALDSPEDEEGGRRAFYEQERRSELGIAKGSDLRTVEESNLRTAVESDQGAVGKSDPGIARGSSQRMARGGIREIEIVILRSWGKEAGIYGVNLW